ncbi:MAG: hypothetical protein PT944_02820 [Actinomycetaceae bacterium]|nr:hypothetical protein [Arcanobacterium sp.]MDD7686837.1 hypothetical protein [Actinomycetaceae bacterium]MDY5273580.1 hypothetical protein [Arcanobacterium sp.]
MGTTPLGTAPRDEQLQLLAVAQLDADIARLRRDDVRHPLRASSAELMNRVGAQMNAIDGNAQQLKSTDSELAALSEQTDALVNVIREKKQLLQAGTGMDSRGLLALQADIDAQHAKLDALSEREFELLERADSLGKRAVQLAHQLAELKEKLLAEQVNLENAVTDIRTHMENLAAQRESLYAPLADQLKREYERAADGGGYVVIGVHPNGVSTGGIELSPIELHRMKNADPETIWLSDEYDCIVVLLDS